MRAASAAGFVAAAPSPASPWDGPGHSAQDEASAAGDRGFAPGDALGVYVHVPFCARACPYCDFDFEVGRRPRLDGRIAAWREGIARELERRRVDLEDRTIDTLYLGGGTPSALGAEALAEVVGSLAGELHMRADAEITVELNPEHVDDALVGALRERGATRVSIGLQSTDAGALATLGRVHDPARGLAAVEAAARAGLDVSVDLIVGWPGQRDEELAADVARIAALDVAHVSVYALTIEADVPWTRLVRRGQRAMPDTDAQGDLLARTEALLARWGFHHYEVASYARPGAGGGRGVATEPGDPISREARHNRKYWTWQDVLALGPSAASVSHDRRTGEVSRRSNPRGLDAWLAGLATGCDGLVERLTGAHAAKEGLWLGLRRLAGFDLTSFLRAFPGVDRAWIHQRLAQPLARGLLVVEDDVVRLAPGAWLHHDAVGAHVLR